MRIFISYASELASAAERLNAELIEAGFGKRNVFLDRDSLEPSRSWNASIQARLESSHVAVLMVTSEALADPKRYVHLEIRRLEERLVRGEIRVLPVFWGDAAPALPPALAGVHGIRVDPERPTEEWLSRVMKGLRALRTRRRLRWSLLLGIPAIAIFCAAFFLWEPAYKAMYCEALHKDTESARFKYFSEGANSVFIVGQSLDKISQEYKPDIIGRIAREKGGRVRILLMAPTLADGTPNPALAAYSEWSPNQTGFPDELKASLHRFKVWMQSAASEGLDVEIRTLSMVPFSANVVDIGLPTAAMQLRPYLYRGQGQDRPVLQFARRCYPEVFDRVLETLEEAWAIATPLEP